MLEVSCGFHFDHSLEEYGRSSLGPICFCCVGRYFRQRAFLSQGVGESEFQLQSLDQGRTTCILGHAQPVRCWGRPSLESREHGFNRLTLILDTYSTRLEILMQVVTNSRARLPASKAWSSLVFMHPSFAETRQFTMVSCSSNRCNDKVDFSQASPHPRISPLSDYGCRRCCL